MTTISFKLPEADARELRRRARREKLSLSESLRRQLFPHGESALRTQRCPHTGAIVFAPAPHLAPLTTAVVREMLADFP